MLPDVDGQDRDEAGAFTDRVVLVGAGGDHEVACSVGGEPGPAGSELSCGSGGELCLAFVYASESGIDLFEQRACGSLGSLSDGGESGEIEVVVIEAAAVVAKGLAQGGILHFVQRSEQSFSIHVCNTGFFCRVIEVFGVGSVMLSKMGLDSQGVNHGFKSIIRIR